MVYRGCVRNGIVVLEGEVQLTEGTHVIVEPVGESVPPSEDSVYRLGDLATPTGVADLATNIDHYLYGHPKASDV